GPRQASAARTRRISCGLPRMTRPMFSSRRRATSISRAKSTGRRAVTSRVRASTIVPPGLADADARETSLGRAGLLLEHRAPALLDATRLPVEERERPRGEEETDDEVAKPREVERLEAAERDLHELDHPDRERDGDR